MKLATVVDNAPIISNVGEIGEFRIRNSAKAFSILSSGLYSNKIRAIIRELSCNGQDSHVAAGKRDVPLYVHLPNRLEPWFSIRDYGTGLSHDQVTNIYTTYFESTKTQSNDFIGALGLGSKSPFSYTDNFTVTAIKDGRKGIYSAFINDVGVPSIALMSEEQTTDSNGVEIKFSVHESADFYAFASEAVYVFSRFDVEPKVEGNSNYNYTKIKYLQKDIIPGVHQIRESGQSFAIMGNIAYPIHVPNEEVVLGDLRKLLSCALEIHFEIGELDFQASREHLSYIQMTVDAIKNKLQKLNDSLLGIFTKEMDAIDNDWDKAFFLESKTNNNLWTACALAYIQKNRVPTVDTLHRHRGCVLSSYKLYAHELKDKYNIDLREFDVVSSGVILGKPDSEWKPSPTGSSFGENVYYNKIRVQKQMRFVINDIPRGAIERIRHHYKNVRTVPFDTRTIYLLLPADISKPMDVAAFFKDIHSPPESMKLLASSLTQKPKKSNISRNVSILRIKQTWRGRQKGTKWEEEGGILTFDDSKNYYYLPLSGFVFNSKSKTVPSITPSDIFNYLQNSGIKELVDLPIYGVRKTDISVVENKPNWINLEDHIINFLNNLDSSYKNEILLRKMSSRYPLLIASEIQSILSRVHLKSKYRDFFDEINIQRNKNTKPNIEIDYLCDVYVNDSVNNPFIYINDALLKCKKVYEEYPLFSHLPHVEDPQLIADYINLVDKSKENV